MANPKRILIIGGSTRAAASSAVRAGLQPVCADLFADTDTQQIAEIVRIHDYPQSLPDDVASVVADAWFYTGSLENHPDLIDRIASRTANYGRLVGCSASALRRLRDPNWVFQTLRSAGYRVSDVRPQSDPPPIDGNWLQKPIASAGGRKIRLWNDSAANDPFAEPWYFQRFVAGVPLSGVFCKGAGAAVMLGASKQLIGLDQSGAMEPFAYCGSVGPITMADHHLKELTRIANDLAIASGLSGLFGIDFQLSDDDLCVIEVNPRYTASVEVIERATQEPVLRRLEEFLSPEGKTDNSTRPASTNVSGTGFAKIIIYTRGRFVAPDISGSIARENQPIELADIPKPGTIIEAGWPVCTVLSGGASTSLALENALVDVRIVCDAIHSNH